MASTMFWMGLAETRLIKEEMGMASRMESSMGIQGPSVLSDSRNRLASGSHTKADTRPDNRLLTTTQAMKRQRVESTSRRITAAPPCSPAHAP